MVFQHHCGYVRLNNAAVPAYQRETGSSREMNKKINRSERPGISPVDSTGIRTIHQGCIEQDFKELAVYCPLVPSVAFQK
jgi:hypothetical protein